jgi:3-oxoacyl-[acyl-carrier protein] reductase
MDLGLNGKRALVLASSRGLGLGVAQALAAEGCHVMLSGRDGERLATAVAEIAKAGGKADYAVSDLSKKDAARALFDAATAKLGGIDILVNNTGGPPAGASTDADAATWAAQFDTMVLRLIELTGLCLPAMTSAGWGRILTLASSGVVQPIPNLALSNTLRSALVGWSKTLSNEVAGKGVTANVLIPGRIATDRVDELDAGAAKRQGKSLDEIRAASRATIPAGRYGRVEEFAAIAAFLVSEPASYITGSVVRCDGGAIRAV